MIADILITLITLALIFSFMSVIAREFVSLSREIINDIKAERRSQQKAFQKS